MSKRAALYLRVSTNGQTVENQRRELEEVAKRHGWEVVNVFEDRGISGAKGREQRPGFKALWQAVTRKQVDVVMAWHVDRLGRSLRDLLNFFQEVQDKGIALYLHQQGIDTTTLAGKALFQMMGVFAEFERGLITERINAGLARTVANGTKLGRKPLEVKDTAKAEQIKAALRASGFRNTRKIGRTLGVGSGTVERIKRVMLAEQPKPTMTDAQALARKLFAEGRLNMSEIQERVKRETGHDVKIRLREKGAKQV